MRHDFKQLEIVSSAWFCECSFAVVVSFQQKSPPPPLFKKNTSEYDSERHVNQFQNCQFEVVVGIYKEFL